ncbi:MAG: SRPBCC family protein [Acidimicrobiia bacterium]|nr:SRPBCC family protein [Acidimicrobiia bacterium]MDX2466899.1 SRPBCC family protein [Acidimicrobiia bacterium]
MPRATFTHQATANAAIEEVWESLQEAETWANIGPVEDIEDSESDDEGQLQSFRWSTTVAMRRYPGTAKVVSVDLGSRMLLDLDAREIVGTLETHLAANGSGTTLVTVTLEVVSRGTISTLFFPVVSETIAKGLPVQVEHFAESLG